MAAGAVSEREAGAFWSQWLPLRCWMMTVCPPESATWNLNVLERMGRVRFFDQAGHREAADQEAAQALLLEGQNTDLLIALAVRERSLGRAAPAEDLFRRALKIDPHHARAANNLAFLLAEQNRNLEEAVGLSRRALLLEPTNPRVLDTLGFALYQQGRFEEAAATLERAQQRARHQTPEVQDEIAFHLARAWVRAGQPGRAQDVLRVLRERRPGLLLPKDLTGLMRTPSLPPPAADGRELDLDTGVR
jgi:tetratricopeptide (TPR) repeat protein